MLGRKVSPPRPVKSAPAQSMKSRPKASASVPAGTNKVAGRVAVPAKAYAKGGMVKGGKCPKCGKTKPCMACGGMTKGKK